MIASLLFALLVIVTSGICIPKFEAIRRNIMLGKPEPVTGDKRQRFRNMMLVALGQQKMFARPIPAVLHLFIYVAFVITQIELIEIFVDGFAGTHRVFAPYLGGLYTFIISFIEILSVLALIATFSFLYRRNIMQLARFRKPELKGWPSMDANLILLGEILLVTFIFMMNGADHLLQQDVNYQDHYHHTGDFAISSWLGPLLFGNINSGTILHFIERIGWWGHVMVVFGFLMYLPMSKHLHIIFAFPNTYFAKLSPAGQMANMPEIQHEVASMLDPSAPASTSTEIPKFGANDVFDLPWRTVLAAYSCTECGRCTSVCPANLTGKQLSPRKVVMNVRDRAEEIGQNLDLNKTEFIKKDQKSKTSVLTAENYDDGRSLFDYISQEELRACTSCNACVEACPVLINPLEVILEMRRNLILEKSSSPDSWNNMFNNLENNGAPWAFSADDREKWF